MTLLQQLLRKMRVAIVLGVALAFASAGKDIKKRGVIQNIVGGNEATPHSYPWMAQILQKDGRLSCGGSLIEGENPNFYYILTAAHCASKVSKKLLRLGDHNIFANDGSEQTFRIPKVKAIIHPGYVRSTLQNDVALIPIPKSAVDITAEVQVGRLTTSDVTAGDLVTVIGWGDLTEGGNISPTLQEVEVTVQSHATCASRYSLEYFQDSMFCAGPLSGGQDSCQGDSGGPVMIDRGSGWEIVGVVSWGYGCARVNNPGVYADIYEALSFINDNIN